MPRGRRRGPTVHPKNRGTVTVTERRGRYNDVKDALDLDPNGRKSFEHRCLQAALAFLFASECAAQLQ
jgi:hypothetical protein